MTHQVAVMGEAETPGGTNQLDENLKKRVRDLGDAINQSLSESEPIAEAIGNIKNQGYEVFLVLEATIGFTKQEEERAEPSPAMVTTDGKSAEPKFSVTAQDMKFLKSMRIGLGD